MTTGEMRGTRSWFLERFYEAIEAGVHPGDAPEYAFKTHAWNGTGSIGDARYNDHGGEPTWWSYAQRHSASEALAVVGAIARTAR